MSHRGTLCSLRYQYGMYIWCYLVILKVFISSGLLFRVIAGMRKRKEHPLGNDRYSQLMTTRRDAFPDTSESDDEEWLPTANCYTKENARVTAIKPSSGESHDGADDESSDCTEIEDDQEANLFLDISFDEGDSIDDPPYSPCASLVSSDSDTADMELSDMEVSEEPVKQRACPKQRRPQKLCPIRGCRSSTQSVSRHLREKHKMHTDQARQIVHSFAERYRKHGNKHTYQDCPHCPSRVVRLDKHLRHSCHGLHGSNKNNPSIPAVSEAQSAAVGTLPQDLSSAREKPLLASISMAAKEPWTAPTAPTGEGPLLAEEVPEQAIKRRRTIERETPLDKQSEEELQQFQLWMSSLAGGSLSPSTATQYALQVRVALSSIGGIQNRDQLASIGNPGGVLEKMRDTHAPSTWKNTCIALKHFSRFLFDRKLMSVLDMSTLHNKIAVWLTSMRKDISQQKCNVQEMSCQAMPAVVSFMQSYGQTKHAREAEEIISSMQAGTVPLTAEYFRLLQEYILMCLIISNGHRAGVLRNLKVKELKQGTLKDGTVLVKVAEHKTSAVYGPARLILSQNMMKNLQTFMTVRNVFFKENKIPDPGVVFVNCRGRALRSNALAKIIRKVNGLELPTDVSTTLPTITPTLFRKGHYEMSRVQNIGANKMADLSGHFCHTRNVAEVYYDSANRDDRARRAFHIIRTNLCKASQVGERKEKVQKYYCYVYNKLYATVCLVKNDAICVNCYIRKLELSSQMVSQS